MAARRDGGPIRTRRTGTLQRVRDWLMMDVRRVAMAGAAVLALVWGGATLALLQLGASPTPDTPATAAATPTSAATQLQMSTQDYPKEPFGITASPTVAPEGHDGPSSTDVASAKRVATNFVKAWLRAGSAKSDEAWVAGMKPYASTALAQLSRMTDRRNVPQATVQEVTASADLGAMAARVTLSNGTALKLSFTRNETGKWLVDGVEPA